MPKVVPLGPEGTIWFGGEPDEASLCLRIIGDELDPDAISRVLGCQPSRCQRKGESVLSSTGEFKRIARTGSWLLHYAVDADFTLVEAIPNLFESLPNDLGVWTLLASQFALDLICDVTIRCVNRGFELPPNILGLLAGRGITLSFDIYCEVDPKHSEALHDRLNPSTGN